MDMTALREWLIANGIAREELDQASIPPVLDDIGNGLLLSLQNDDDIGNMLVGILMDYMDLKARVEALEGGAV